MTDTSQIRYEVMADVLHNIVGPERKLHDGRKLSYDRNVLERSFDFMTQHSPEKLSREIRSYLEIIGYNPVSANRPGEVSPSFSSLATKIASAYTKALRELLPPPPPLVLDPLAGAFPS